jgi:hypothetical protein
MITNLENVLSDFQEVTRDRQANGVEYSRSFNFVDGKYELIGYDKGTEIVKKDGVEISVKNMTLHVNVNNVLKSINTNRWGSDVFVTINADRNAELGFAEITSADFINKLLSDKELTLKVETKDGFSGKGIAAGNKKPAEGQFLYNGKLYKKGTTSIIVKMD